MAQYTVKKEDTPSAIAKKNGTTPTQTAMPTQTTTPTTEPWSYKEFQASQATTAADQNRQDLASQKPGDFTYGAYEKSDTVKQAEALLQQQLANKPGAYQSAWQTQLDDTLNKILNREKFSYDLNGDALYQQYKDQYMLQGQQAMMDTMGQAAAMTGGYGNSYAQTAGQQTYQGYLQQLNDRVPELYQLALDQYNREGQELYNQYGLYADRDQTDYGRHRDSVTDYYTNLDYLTNDARYQGEQDYGRYMDGYNMAYGQHRDKVGDWQYDLGRADEDYWNQYNRDYGQYMDGYNMGYQQHRDQVSDAQWDQSFQYQQGRDQVADNQWNQSFEYQQGRDQKADEQWNQSFQYQQDRDQKADEQWQATFDEGVRQFNEQMALSSSKSTGGSGGSGGSGGNGNGGSKVNNGSRSKEEIIAMQKALGVDPDGKWGPKTQAAAKKQWGTTDADAAWKANGSSLGGGDGFTGTTYSEAIAYAKAHGVDGSYTNAIMHQSDFSRKKASSSPSEAKEFDTYQEYLQYAVESMIDAYGK